jgi:hypothetical protein
MRRRVRVQPERKGAASNSPYRCESCCATEQIPIDVLAYFDEIDPDDTGSPATFQCETCGGIMYPEWWFRA